MPRSITNRQVTILKEIWVALGIKPGDDIAFEESESDHPFEKYRGSAESDETMPDRMRWIRGEYPRDVSNEEDDDSETEA